MFRVKFYTRGGMGGNVRVVYRVVEEVIKGYKGIICGLYRGYKI